MIDNIVRVSISRPFRSSAQIEQSWDTTLKPLRPKNVPRGQICHGPDGLGQMFKVAKNTFCVSLWVLWVMNHVTEFCFVPIQTISAVSKFANLKNLHIFGNSTPNSIVCRNRVAF